MTCFGILNTGRSQSHSYFAFLLLLFKRLCLSAVFFELMDLTTGWLMWIEEKRDNRCGKYTVLLYFPGSSLWFFFRVNGEMCGSVSRHTSNRHIAYFKAKDMVLSELPPPWLIGSTPFLHCSFLSPHLPHALLILTFPPCYFPSFIFSQSVILSAVTSQLEFSCVYTKVISPTHTEGEVTGCVSVWILICD